MRIKKTILKIFKAVFEEDDQECYMIFKGGSKLPGIDTKKYTYNYYINNSVKNCIHLCWLESKKEK